VHRRGTWPARRWFLSSASQAKRHTGARGSAQTLGLTGSPVPKSTVALRVFADELEPHEVTALLGCEPTRSYRKGDLVSPGRSAATRKYGMWSLVCADSEPEAFDQQIQSLLARLTPDLQVWQSLAAEYRVDLFCGYFMSDSNQGFTLSATTVSALAARQLEIGFDIYSTEPEDTTPSQEREA